MKRASVVVFTLILLTAGGAITAQDRTPRVPGIDPAGMGRDAQGLHDIHRAAVRARQPAGSGGCGRAHRALETKIAQQQWDRTRGRDRNATYNKQWRDYSTLEVKAGDHAGNQMRLRQFQDDETWSRLGKPVERWRWGFTPQTVNASYSATNNEITFPAGILQPPFFNLEADDAINYGAIAVIGHEISHGFDDQGRKSDGDSNLRDWWTAEDASKFEERATKLGAQFESFAGNDDQRR